MKRVKRDIVAAVLLSRDNKVLLGRMREGGVYPNTWHIPGGGVDEGETKIEALVREIREEVEIDISSCEIELVSDDDSGEAVKMDRRTGEEIIAEMKFFNYLVKLNKNANEVGENFGDDLVRGKWVDVEDLKEYEFNPPSKKLFGKLGWI